MKMKTSETPPSFPYERNLQFRRSSCIDSTFTIVLVLMEEHLHVEETREVIIEIQAYLSTQIYVRKWVVNMIKFCCGSCS